MIFCTTLNNKVAKEDTVKYCSKGGGGYTGDSLDEPQYDSEDGYSSGSKGGSKGDSSRRLKARGSNNNNSYDSEDDYNGGSKMSGSNKGSHGKKAKDSGDSYKESNKLSRSGSSKSGSKGGSKGDGYMCEDSDDNCAQEPHYSTSSDDNRRNDSRKI